MLNGFTRHFKPFEIFNEEHVEATWKAIFTVLEETGVRFEQKRAIEILRRGGCQVETLQNKVKFPPDLVTECLRKCPSSFAIKAREPKNDLVMGGNKLYFSSTPGTHTLDLDTWDPRVPTRKEFYDAVIIYDALDHLHMLHSNSPYHTFEGVHPLLATVETFAARTRNSSKINRAGPAFGNDRFQIEIAQAVGARPMFGLPASPPLMWGEDTCDAALRIVEAGFSVMLATGDIYGATAPVTLAGSIVHNCATLVAAIVFIQLVKEGTPVLPSNFTWPMNMRTGEPAYGNIAVALHDVAFNQVWRRYNIPVGNLGAGIGSSKKIDFQNGYERGMLALMSAISGATMVWFHGCVHGELISHPVQAILDDDVAGMIGRFIEGMEVSDATLAINLINQVGPIPGSYLDQKHTREWWMKEQFLPKTADLLSLPEWTRSGKKSCIDHARDRMEQILATHRPTPLTANQEKDIERVLQEAKKYHALSS
jgi:trimethylamine:corrinoid methyltransferase-like protein